MTREEIIRNLKYTMEKHKSDNVSTFGTNIYVMCKDTLDYLEQELCDDCIRRKAVIENQKVIYKEYCKTDNEKALMEELARLNQELPSVVPKQETVTEFTDRCRECESMIGRKMKQKMGEWIPVSERLPEKDMHCLVSVGKLYLTQIAIYSDLMGTIDHKIFYQGNYGYGDFNDITEYVKAWMPLPEPYKAESEVEK